MKDLLPIGSVVALKNGKNHIMICGRLQEREEDGKIFDYSAVHFPEGILQEKQLRSCSKI